MDIATILNGVIGVGLALGGGAAGKKAGESEKVGGDTPWQKLLGPAGAIAVGTIYEGVTGDSETAVQIAVGGAQIGVIATGLFSSFKNIKELVNFF